MGKRIVSISGELFTEMITEGFQAGDEVESVRCIEGLPEGAKFLGIDAIDDVVYRRDTEPRLFTVRLLYEHPDWPDCGPPYPMQQVTFQRGWKAGDATFQRTVRAGDW